MGTFTFKWPHAAEEVYVTGTFDNWSKSEKLEKVGDHFEKTVTLPENTENIFYKFVVDGNWTTDHEAPIAKDSEGNDNNLLKVEDIKQSAPPMAAVLSNVTPDSTTVGLASNVPLEPKREAHVEDKKDTPAEQKSSAPGAFPETPAADADKQFSVNPLPATDFAVNPIELTAGEKVPKDVAANGINDHVTLDKESYEKSDRIPGLTGLTAPTDLAPTSIGTIIPESSLPIIAGDVTTNSAAPESSTAALAAKVPLEHHHHEAPKVVKDSQEKSGEEVGASGVEELKGDKVDEKAEVEEELLSKVPEAPSTAEGTSGKGTDKTEHTKSAVEYIAAGAGAVGVGLLAVGLAAKDAVVHAAQSETAQNAAQQVTEAATSAKDSSVASGQSAAQQASTTTTNAKDSVVTGTQSAAQQTSDAAVNAKDTAVASTNSAVESTKAAAVNAAAQLPDSVKNVLPASVQAAIPKPETKEEVIEKISPEVPVEVKESIAESGQAPEAATNTAAVEQKSAVESELLKEVDEAKAFNDKPAKPAGNVPSEVKESITESGKAPEAASSAAAVDNKAAVESELLKEVETAKPIDEQHKSETLPTEPASTSVESKLLDGAKDSLPSVDDKPKDTPSTQPKAAEAAPQLDLPTPPAVVPLVATPVPGPDVKTEARTEFPTEVTNGSEAASSKPATESAALPILPKAEETPKTQETTPAPATPAKTEAPTTPAKATTPAASSSKGSESPANTAERKKKNRLSSFFGKIKDKVSHKDNKP
ncbi:hypothetical protein GE09DRAFT_316019 [Coniochaeta sp. 2T2.1]|nr:hypothetical protein GE09DRAFT_316019 [Coniochaeta sp. 2T2.1]